MARPLSPGEKLFIWILDRYKKLKAGDSSWITRISQDFDLEDLEKYLLRSTSFMLLRKLIWNALFYINTYVDLDQSRQCFDRDYLVRCLGFNSQERREILKMTFDCVAERNRDISNGLLNRLKAEAKLTGSRCSLCGREINYEANGEYNSFSLDHIWPRSLGGNSDEWNLRTSCKQCNDKRQNLADSCDVHYEHFHISVMDDSEDKTNFKKEFEWKYRFAALFKSDLKCEMCGVPISQAGGEFDFIPIRTEEIINMFNVKTVCSKHIKS